MDELWSVVKILYRGGLDPILVLSAAKEVAINMNVNDRGHLKTIIDREKLMTLKRCHACGHLFNLGDPVVLACGAWDGPPRLIHEEEAVYDARSDIYIERKCYTARQK
jgi:hypothetical protein